MDKILEALSKALPDEQFKEVSAAIKGYLTDAKTELKAELEAEAQSELDKAYEKFSGEVKEGEKVAEQGYKEAYAIIEDLRNRLETQRAEMQATLDEGYEEAYQMILAEKGEKEKLETTLYEQYESNLGKMRDYMVDKLDQFLKLKGKEIYEQARRDIMSDPRTAEKQVVLDKIIENVSDYISDEQYTAASSTKLAEAQKAVQEANGRVKLLEARATRLSAENTKLNESVRHNEQVIREAAENDKNRRADKAKNVTGKGNSSFDPKREKVIAEFNNNAAEVETEESDTTATVAEAFDPAALAVMRVLSGVKTTEKQPAKK
jgi:hypothetical protein